MVMTQEQSSSHHSRRVILLPSKRVEADEKSDFRSMLSVFLNSEALLQKEFFLQCHPVNQQFCIGVSTKGFYGS